MTGPESVRVREAGPVAWITLDRPPLNILDIPLMRELGRVVGELAEAKSILALEGAGPRGFSAGADVRDHTPERVGEMLEAFHGVFRRLWQADTITVAAVRGKCLGGGCELATFCDFVLAEESAEFGQPEIRLGCFPPVAMVTFPRLVGPRAALDLILTGRTIHAAEALALGLITRVVPDGELDRAARTLVEELSRLSPAVLRMTRRLLRGRIGLDFESALAETEAFYLAELMKTEDAREGIQAFLEKRQPAWRGR
jgi:cyclohexa-1,5-dienecarbonyl-CoA hydratase